MIRLDLNEAETGFSTKFFSLNAECNKIEESDTPIQAFRLKAAFKMRKVPLKNSTFDVILQWTRADLKSRGRL